MKTNDATRLQDSEAPGWAWVDRGCLALWVVALFAATWRNMDLLGDSFWSVATGQWILTHRRLPVEDPFSYTAERPWIVHMPLSQVLFACVMQRFGVMGLVLFGSLLFTGALLLLWLPHARGIAARMWVWPLVLWLVLRQADDLCVRGQVFGDLGYAVLLLLLFRLRDGRAVHGAIAMALGCLWINLHASVFLAVVMPVGFGVAVLSAPATRRPSLGPWVRFSALVAAGTLLNPYGIRLVADLVTLMRASSTHRIDLFRPPDFGSPGTWLSLVLVVGSMIASLGLRTPEAGVPEALVLGALLLAGCTARRYEPLGLGFAIVVLGRILSRRLLAAAPRGRAFARPARLAMAAAAAALSFRDMAVDKDPWRDVPVVEARLIDELGLPDRVANIYHWGGYLDYVWAGHRKVFIDGRNQLYDRRVFDDSLRLASLNAWEAILDDYGVNTVLWERGSPLDRALGASPDWVRVRRGRIAVVYVRRSALGATPLSR